MKAVVAALAGFCLGSLGAVLVLKQREKTERAPGPKVQKQPTDPREEQRAAKGEFSNTPHTRTLESIGVDRIVGVKVHR